MEFEILKKSQTSRCPIFEAKKELIINKNYFQIGEAKGISLKAIMKKLKKEKIDFSLIDLMELSRKELRSGSYRYYIKDGIFKLK